MLVINGSSIRSTERSHGITGIAGISDRSVRSALGWLWSVSIVGNEMGTSKRSILVTGQ